MDEYTPEAIVNRDEPVPVVSVGKQRDESDPKPSAAGHQRSASAAGRSLQDKLFAKLLQQVIPTEDVNDDSVAVGDKRPVDPKRPAFSLPLMANNFRRFNARIGIVFSFQTRVERLLTWRKSSHTISFLFIYSFICLDPHLLVIIPIASVLLFVMVPAFLARHPPPPSTSTSSITPYYSYQGPALAPAKTIKPAPETSKDFFRNMRDLQNVMADFSDIHDATVSAFAPMTNFSNEKLSSVFFLLCTMITALLFLTAHLLPWRYILLVGGNAAILSSHPSLQELFQNIAGDLTNETAGQAPKGYSIEKNDTMDVLGLSLPSSPSATMSSLRSLADISLDTYPEEREVEIFEIQYRSLAPYSNSQWDHFLFSPMPYDPLSPLRIAGDRPKGCRFFEDVQPPPGWAWKSKKWELDLDCREWVVERMITGVGFEVSEGVSEESAANDEIGGWVWDLPSSTSNRDNSGVTNALGYEDFDSDLKSSVKGEIKKVKRKGKGRASQDFEEKGGTGLSVMGEWRRRRWARIVHRTSMPSDSDKGQTAGEGRD
ncbi:PEX28-32 family peroxisomal membrane protein [Aspergillus alliaceus]|uniref:PEX28-32 family peroxisomal membrane protein n=1 Tax=Petromyces alliaceus TaxID=209559 RepID=UPI0012A4F29E|nr:Peroxin/Dysferlin domain-containing protein [Aspergillus alliaceus]KAB8236109.1 Peroxin/Dysferlin domain-containing protein [Aspergillus alliaceus]